MLENAIIYFVLFFYLVTALRPFTVLTVIKMIKITSGQILCGLGWNRTINLVLLTNARLWATLLTIPVTSPLLS